uniref:SCAN box domain-containing protein n=1 Tax=Trichuris muris TaxID=70415 RepID=A0A5S6QP85_TRIMR
MDSPKKKSRQYSKEYLKFGFTCSPANTRLPMCLICEKVFSNEAFEIERALYEGEAVQSLHIAEITLMIAKSGKPHSIGEDLILPATAEILETVLHQPAPTIISKIPLSRRTVQRRIDAMAQDIKATLCIIVKNTEFALQIDESTPPGNEAVLLAYVRFIKEERLVQELLFAKEHLTDTKEHFGGCYRWSTVDAVHCVLHRQQLVAKRLSARLNSSLQYVIQELCDENDEELNRLLIHTEVRWLSKERDYSLCDNLRKSKMDIAYLADLYFKFNEMNKQLQSNELNLIKTKAVISAFLSKLMLFKCNFARGEFCQLPTLAKHLQMLYGDFLRRFDDLLSLVIPSWHELIDLQSNEEIKARMKRGYEYFWLHEEIPARYPGQQ